MADEHQLIASLEENIATAILGKPEPIHLSLVALLAGGLSFEKPSAQSVNACLIRFTLWIGKIILRHSFNYGSKDEDD